MAEVEAMAFPILVQQTNGRFTATLTAVPAVSGVAETRSGALAALQPEVQSRLNSGELAVLKIECGGVSQLAGRFADDPTLREICADVYAARDAERLT